MNVASAGCALIQTPAYLRRPGAHREVRVLMVVDTCYRVDRGGRRLPID